MNFSSLFFNFILFKFIIFIYICWQKIGKEGGKEKKKENKKEPTPKKQAEEEKDATDVALAEEPKSKDPFEGIPKGSFDMDDFKRCYSNEDVDKSIPYFWEKFDPEHYSIWFAEYKYPEELKKVFMSCNLITGKGFLLSLVKF